MGVHRKLDFILMYMKENPNQSYHGYCFDLSQLKVSKWIRFLAPVLESALQQLGLAPTRG
ncbi:MAG: transposase family protein [Bacteroidia bacterium]